MTAIVVPAFCYCFARQTRALLAWGALREGRKISLRRRVAVRLLAERLGISPTNARRLLHSGNGRFWRLNQRCLRLFSVDELWRQASRRSTVAKEPQIAVPSEALHSLRACRAYLLQPTYSRGTRTPIATATTARLAECSMRSVRRYRHQLRLDHRLVSITQYEKRQRQTMKMKDAHPLRPGEFVKQGWIYGRVPDIIVLLDSTGKPVDFLANVRHRPEPQPRRYFFNRKQIRAWQRQGREVAPDAVLKVFGGEQGDEWVSVPNVLGRQKAEGSTTLETKRSSSRGPKRSDGMGRLLLSLPDAKTALGRTAASPVLAASC